MKISQEEQSRDGAVGLSSMIQPGSNYSTRNTKDAMNATKASATANLNASNSHRRSASKSNIMSVEDSVTSLVDFDLSESKFTIAGMLQDKDPSPGIPDTKPISVSKQGSVDSQQLPLSANR